MTNERAWASPFFIPQCEHGQVSGERALGWIEEEELGGRPGKNYFPVLAKHKCTHIFDCTVHSHLYNSMSLSFDMSVLILISF